MTYFVQTTILNPNIFNLKSYKTENQEVLTLKLLKIINKSFTMYVQAHALSYSPEARTSSFQ